MYICLFVFLRYTGQTEGGNKDVQNSGGDKDTGWRRRSEEETPDESREKNGWMFYTNIYIVTRDCFKLDKLWMAVSFYVLYICENLTVCWWCSVYSDTTRWSASGNLQVFFLFQWLIKKNIIFLIKVLNNSCSLLSL